MSSCYPADVLFYILWQHFICWKPFEGPDWIFLEVCLYLTSYLSGLDFVTTSLHDSLIIYATLLLVLYSCTNINTFTYFIFIYIITIFFSSVTQSILILPNQRSWSLSSVCAVFSLLLFQLKTNTILSK